MRGLVKSRKVMDKSWLPLLVFLAADIACFLPFASGGVQLGGTCHVAADCAVIGASCSKYTSVSSGTSCCMGTGASCSRGIDCCGSDCYCIGRVCVQSPSGVIPVESPTRIPVPVPGGSVVPSPSSGAGEPLGGQCNSAAECSDSAATCSYYSSVSSAKSCCMGSGISCSRGIDCCGSDNYCIGRVCVSNGSPAGASPAGSTSGLPPSLSTTVGACGVLCRVGVGGVVGIVVAVIATVGVLAAVLVVCCRRRAGRQQQQQQRQKNWNPQLLQASVPQSHT